MPRRFALPAATLFLSGALAIGLGSPVAAGADEEDDCIPFDPAAMLDITHDLVGSTFTFRVGVKNNSSQPCDTTIKFGVIDTTTQEQGQGGSFDTDVIWSYYEQQLPPYPVSFTVPCNYEAFLGYGGDPDTVDYDNLTFLTKVPGTLDCPPPGDGSQPPAGGPGIPGTGGTATLAWLAALLIGLGVVVMRVGRRAPAR